MAISFPTSPADGQTYTYGGIEYTYAAASNTWSITADYLTMLSANNLSEVADPAAALANIGGTTKRDARLNALLWA